MSLVELLHQQPQERASWQGVCALDELEPFWGEAILLGGTQIALFFISADEIYAVDHLDPDTGAAVMARGIVGSRGDRPTVASPLHKQVYDLETGACFGDPELLLGTYRTRVVDGVVEIEVLEIEVNG